MKSKEEAQWAGEAAPWLGEIVVAEDPGLVFQHPHGGSRPSVTSIPGDLMPSFGLQETGTQVTHIKSTSHYVSNLGQLTTKERLFLINRSVLLNLPISRVRKRR